MGWYYTHNGDSVGPIDENQVEELVSQGRINSGTMVWTEGYSDWRLIGESALAGYIRPEAAVSESVVTGGEPRYAGFWIRVGAALIDGLITGAFGAVLGVAFGVLMSLMPERTMALNVILQGLNFIIGFLYGTLLIPRYGRTLGMMAAGIRVVNGDGSCPISYPKAFGRYFANILNGFTLGIGYLLVVFDSRKRALHDMICDTRVVYYR